MYTTLHIFSILLLACIILHALGDTSWRIALVFVVAIVLAHVRLGKQEEEDGAHISEVAAPNMGETSIYDEMMRKESSSWRARVPQTVQLGRDAQEHAALLTLFESVATDEKFDEWFRDPTVELTEEQRGKFVGVMVRKEFRGWYRWWRA